MVAEYVVERHRQEVEVEDGGFRDERAAAGLVTFRSWLVHYPWPCREEAARARRDGPVDVAA